MSEKWEDRIPESIEDIEPSAGAKERMLANIRRKAAEQNAMKVHEPAPQAKAASMNKVTSTSAILKWAMPMAACLVIAIVGVNFIANRMHTPSTDTPEVQIGNPFVSVEGAQEFKTKLGIVLNAPEGAENVEYTIIDNEMANIDFNYAEHSYTLRASKQGGDFSGLYGTDAGSEQIDSSTDALLTAIRSEEEIYRKLEWTDGKIRYVLLNTDGADPEQMKEIYKKVK